MNMIGHKLKFVYPPPINSACLVEQVPQADGYLASQNPFSVFGNPDQMKSQTMLGMRSSPVFLHYTLKYATKTGLRPALSGGTTGRAFIPSPKGLGVSGRFDKIGTVK